jgi:hypothetical protein
MTIEIRFQMRIISPLSEAASKVGQNSSQLVTIGEGIGGNVGLGRFLY